jgi:hypothetical protein
MKTNPFHHVLCAGLLLAGVTASQAVPVTFQVNMGYQISLGAFNPATDQVTVHGSFTTSWGPSAPMTPSGGDPNVYQVTIDIGSAAGTIEEYKYVIGAGGWENDPNRYLTVPASAQTLGVAYYNNQWAGGPDVSVQFSVNMSAQIGAGNFDPVNDTVQARGGFNGWSALELAPNPGNPAIYEGSWTSGATAPGAQVQYKFTFVKGATTTWESRGNVPYGNDHNRLYTMATTNQTLPTVYFGDVSGYPIKAAAFFEVNVQARILTGGFDPATDQVWVRGNAMGWGSPEESQGFQLFPDPSRPGSYTNTYKMESRLTGQAMEYKHTLWRTNTTGGGYTTVWEDGSNKVLVWDGSEPTIDGGYHLRTSSGLFNGQSASDFLSADTVVTFRVNMAGAVGVGGTPVFNPNAPDYMFVAINGSFISGGWWTWNGGPPYEFYMLDDGASHGDAVAGDMIFTDQFTFPKGSPVRVQYKYGINGEDNEAAPMNDHVRYIRAVGTYVMPIDTFGVMTQEADPGSLAIAKNSATQVTITWNGRPGVRLQATASLTGGTWADVPGTDGASSSVQTIGSGNLFYRLTKL